MGMRALMEALQGQASEAVAAVREGAAAEGEYVEPTGEGDGESLEPEEPTPQSEASLFDGWEEGVPLVATGAAVGYTEDGDEVEVDQDTTAEVVGVLLDADPPGAVLALEDGTQIAVEADGAAMWAIVTGDEGAEIEDYAADPAVAEEGVDPLMGALRRIIDEARKGAARGRKGKGKGKGGKGCDGDGPGPQARQGMAEAVEAPPSDAEEAAKAYVYAQLLVDVLAGMPSEEVSKAGGNLAELADRFLVRAKPLLRKLGVSPAAVQRLAGKVVSRVDGLAATIVGGPAQ